MNERKAILISDCAMQCLTLLAQKRGMEPDNASVIADEIIGNWLETSDEGKVVLEFVEAREKDWKLFAGVAFLAKTKGDA